ncbi:MAG: hypothetical protein MUC67_04920, partial [Acidobacteria bacterium]|nr:hypothetical protein [Acidobacteriota bacterium]
MATRAFEFDLDAARREDGGGAFEFDLDRARASERMEAAPTLEKLAAPPTMIETAGDYIREGAGALGDAAAAVRDWMPAPVRGTLGAVSTLPATVGSQLTEGGRQLQRRAWDKAIAAEEQRLGRALSTMEALALLPGVGTLGREAFDPERESSVGGVLEAAANIGTDPTVAATGGARAGLGALGASVARTAPNAGRLATAAGGAANVLGSAAVGSVYLPDLAEGVARGVENADPASAMGMAALGGLLAKGAGVEAREVGSALARRFRGDSGAPAASPGAAVRPEAPEPEAPVQQAPEPAPAPTPEPRAAEAQGDDLALAQQFAQENDAAQARPGAFRIAEDRVADLTDRMAEASDPAEIARLAEARKVYADFVAREADRGFTLDDLEADLDGEPARAAEPAPAPRAVEPEPEPEQGFTAGRRPTLEEINAGTVGLDDIRGRMEALRQRRAAEAPTPEGMRQADEEARIEAAVPPKPEAPAARPVVNDRPIVPLDYNGAVELRMWHKPKLDRAEKVTTLEGVAELEAIRADIQARLDATLKARTRNAATKRQRQDAANLLVKELDAYKTAIRQAKTRTTKAGIAAGTIAPKPPRVEKATKWYERALQTPEGERTTLQRRMLGDLEASKPDDPLDGHLVAEIPGLMKNGKPRVNALDNGPTGYEAVQDKTAKQVAAAIAEDKNNPTYLELRESFADAMERRGAD